MQKLEFIFSLTEFIDVFLKGAFRDTVTIKRKPHIDSNIPAENQRTVFFSLFDHSTFFPHQRHIVVDTFFGYDEESMDSETSSVASLRMDRTPATPDEDLEMVRTCIPSQNVCLFVCFKHCWFQLVHQRACPMRSRSCVSVSWPGSIRPYSGPTPCCRSRRAAFWMQKWRQRYRIDSHPNSFNTI